jgi:hypothetical protein
MPEHAQNRMKQIGHFQTKIFILKITVMASVNLADVSDDLIAPLMGYCAERVSQTHEDLRSVIQLEVQITTGFETPPELMEHLARVKSSPSDRIVQKMRSTRYPPRGGRYVIGYHQTDGASAGCVMHHEFRVGPRHRLFGAAIYFATSLEDTKRKATHHGPILECVVNLGRPKCVTCADNSLTLSKLNAQGYDSVWAEAGIAMDGRALHYPEFCVYEPHRVRMRAVHLDESQVDENIRMLAHMGDCHACVRFIHNGAMSGR